MATESSIGSSAADIESDELQGGQCAESNLGSYCGSHHTAKEEKEGTVIQGLSGDKVEMSKKPMASESGAGSSFVEIESDELQGARSAESRLVLQRSLKGSLSNPAFYSNSLQGSPAPFSRYHSAPSALGFTALLHDHTMSENSGSHLMALSTRSGFSSSFACLSASVQESEAPLSEELSPESVVMPQCSTRPFLPPSSPSPQQPSTSPSASTLHLSTSEKSNAVYEHCAVVPPPSSPPCIPSPSLSTLHLSASEKLNAAHEQCSVVPPRSPQVSSHPPSSSGTTLHLSASQKLNAIHEPCSVVQVPDRGISGSVSPSPPPPFSHSEPFISSSIEKSIEAPPPPSPPPFSSAPSPPPPPPLPSSSPNFRNKSVTSPTPPPPPPPVTTTSASTTRVMSSSLPHKVSPVAPPPPPPPLRSGLTRSPTTSSSAPAPPPPPKESMPKISQHGPPVPPPPAPFSNGKPKAGVAATLPHPPSSNGIVPPPPPGAKGKLQPRSTPRNVTQSKKSNLKPYHWLKLTRAVQGSLWADAQWPDEASKAPDFDMSELESLFAASVPHSDHGSSGGKSNRRGSGSKPDKVNLIDLRRAYNCEIMLTKVKIPLSDLMSSVLTLDDSALDIDQVENLIKFCPTKEEMVLLKNYNGDKDNLGKCEQFFLELMKVPRVESKLRVFSFKMQFNSQVSDLRKNLNVINSTCDEVRSSVKLKRIMQTILSLGNALNHGTARGSAVGFRLDSLLKLTDTRARNNKMTLMHYLCKVLSEKLPELLDFPEDLNNVEAATKIQLKYLAEEMQAISKGLEKVVQELTASENDGPVSENFCKSLKEFLGFAEAEVRSLASLYSGVGRNADTLAQYFGEDPARCPFEQVVMTLHNFVRMFIRAHNENCKQIEFEKKKALKDAENEKAKLITSKKEQEKEKSHLIQSM